MKKIPEDLKIRADKDRELLIKLSLPDFNLDDLEENYGRLDCKPYDVHRFGLAIRIREHLKENP